MSDITTLIQNPLNGLTDDDRVWLRELHPEQIRRLSANFAPRGCSHSGRCANSGRAVVTNVTPLELPGQPTHNRDAYAHDVTPMPLPGEWD